MTEGRLIERRSSTPSVLDQLAERAVAIMQSEDILVLFEQRGKELDVRAASFIAFDSFLESAPSLTPDYLQAVLAKDALNAGMKKIRIEPGLSVSVRGFYVGTELVKNRVLRLHPELRPQR